MGDNFWESNLLRGCSAWVINDQTNLRAASEDCLEACFVWLVVRGNYVWCLIIFVIFMRFGGVEVGDALKSSFGLGNPWGNFNGKEGVGFSLYVILLCWNFVTGYCEKIHRIPPFLIFLLFHLFYIYWDWKDQKCKLKCP